MPKAFTMIELMLVMALMAILAGLSIPIYQQVQVRNDLEVAANSFAQSARRAQLLSQTGDRDANWGVEVHTGSITVFQGSSYALRDTDFDEVFLLPSGMTASGSTEIVFDKLTGETSSAGTLTLTSVLNESRNLSINEKGNISF